MVCPGDLEGVRGEIKGAGGIVIVFRDGPLGIRGFFSPNTFISLIKLGSESILTEIPGQILTGL